ncbi:MAG: carbamate kinase, partial [Kiritimatiellia bacterium]|nr:carbamate kinase [Kiritimatiellia bacterium]
MEDLVVIAVGGNALIRDTRHMTVLDQYRAAGQTSHHIAAIVRRGHRVLITHGNGPQVGFILLRSEIAKDTLHRVPLSSCVADTQGAIGFQMEQTLANELHRTDVDRTVVAVVTQAVVDANDPAFGDPRKPVGPFLSREEAEKHRDSDGWVVGEDAGRGWRRMVASPRPLEIVEESAIG